MPCLSRRLGRINRRRENRSRNQKFYWDLSPVQAKHRANLSFDKPSDSELGLIISFRMLSSRIYQSNASASFPCASSILISWLYTTASVGSSPSWLQSVLTLIRHAAPDQHTEGRRGPDRAEVQPEARKSYSCAPDMPFQEIQRPCPCHQLWRRDRQRQRDP